MRRGSSWLFSVGLFSSVLVALGVGCSETGTTTPDGGASADGGQTVSESGAPDTSAPDASGPDAGCTGACRSLALGATYGAVTASFERAQFGRDKTGPNVSGVTVEVHAGGAPECPKQNSPTPDRTLIVSGIKVGSEGKTLTLADGVAVTLLDFKELLTKKPLDKATAAKLTVVAIEGTPPDKVAFDLEATFEEGTIRGHVFADHCATMDE